MTSTCSRRLLGLFFVAMSTACGLPRPPDPPPFDCERIDRADERFPDRCADAGEGEDAGSEEEDAGLDTEDGSGE